MSNYDNNSNFSSEEVNPIVIQLCEFGYDSVYSKRIFYYYHPEDLEEALNYMSTQNGIIQHRFVHNRNTSNNICYICGEEQDIHLKELSININSNENTLEDQKENNKINTNQIHRNARRYNNNNLNNYLRAPFSSLTINSNEYNTNKKNKNNRRNKRYNKNNYNNYLSSEILGINFKKENKKPQKSKTI